jgi:phospholipase C
VNYHHLTPTRSRSLKILGAPGIRTLRALGLLAAQAPGGRHLFGLGGLEDFLMSKLQFTANLYPLRRLSVRNHLRPLEALFDDAAHGRLPAFSIVDPDFDCFSEENPQDISIGEGFAAAIVGAAMSGEGWANTVLIWTYDEHGGYYDHVPPPEAVPPDAHLGHSLLTWLGAFDWLLRRFRLWRLLKEADEGRIGDKLLPRTYDRLGFRVPTVIVSPLARPDYVSSRDGPKEGPGGPIVYDHTSILKTIERKWNLPALTRRDAAAPDILDALDLEHAAFADPPTLAPPTRPWAVP